MKKFRKIMAVLVAAIMIISSFTLTAFASAYVITIDNAIKGEEYNAYKVFDVTYQGTPSGSVATLPTLADPYAPGEPDPGHQNKTYAYTISNATTNAVFNALTSSVSADVTATGMTHSGTAGTPGETYSLPNFGIKLVLTTTPNLWVVENSTVGTDPTADQMKALATYLDGKKGTFTAAATKTSAQTAAETTTNTPANGAFETCTTTLDVGAAGYYFVDTSTGSVCSLDTTEPTATIREKNGIPTSDKVVTDKEAAGTTQDDTSTHKSTTVNVGDTVQFTITVNNVVGTDKKIVVHDTMTSGLTLDASSFKVYLGATGTTEVTQADNWNIFINSAASPKNATAGSLPAGVAVVNAKSNQTGIGAVLNETTACTFEVYFSDSYIASLADDAVLRVVYEAELNQTAQMSDANTNTSHIDYANQSTVDKTTNVKTWQFQVAKTDNNNKLLDGAEFKIYDAATGGNELTFTKESDGVYVKVDTVTGSTAAGNLDPTNAGVLTVKGLENGTYYVEEVVHPAGYKQLTERKAVTINGANNNVVLTGDGQDTYSSGGVQVINLPGAELPSTGGMGTTVLYIVGGMLVILAGAYLFFSRKKTA